MITCFISRSLKKVSYTDRVQLLLILTWFVARATWYLAGGVLF